MSVEVSMVDGPLGPADPWGRSGAGALVCFDGVVRPEEEGRPLRALHYEAYEPMAPRVLRALAERLLREHGLLAVCVEHSRGEVPVGACSFRLRVAARHRKEALAMMDAFIDAMKRDAPIWKAPVWADEPVTTGGGGMSGAGATSRPHEPAEAMAALLGRVLFVETETVRLDDAAGRVLAEPIVADRPSPACDASAMDGYAVRLADLEAGRPVPVAAEVAIGQAPPPLPAGAAVRVFTGGAVPEGADLVVPRERVEERGDSIVPIEPIAAKAGEHIRRRGENTPGGATLLRAGAAVTPAVAGALAAFGVARPRVFRRVRLRVICTGNEVLPVESEPSPWQLRDSNGPLLRAMFAGVPWLDLAGVERVPDDEATLTRALAAAVASADAVLLTGGVSMGDYDFVPRAVEAVGAETVFHKVALRPGKPLLGAVAPGGAPVLGLPGNPVSVAVTARRWATAALRKRAGFAAPQPEPPRVALVDGGDKRLPLWWYRPVRLTEEGAHPVRTMGSGDAPSIAGSDGFVELPPNGSGDGPWPFYSWSVT